MNITLALIAAALALIGEMLSIPEKGTIEETSDKNGCPWTHSPLLKVIYGASIVIGIVFVLWIILYLTFKVHWWFILVGIGGYPVASVLAVLVNIVLELIFKPKEKEFERMDLYYTIRLKRKTGILFILGGLLVYFL